MIMVFLNKITRKITRQLFLKDNIINKVDNCYKYSRHVTYLIFVYLNVIWLHTLSPTFMVSLLSGMINLRTMGTNEKKVQVQNFPIFLRDSN